MINGLVSPTMALAAKGGERLRAAEAAKDPAKEFEGLMLSMMLSNMRKSSFGGEGLFPGDKSDTLGGLFDMMISGQLSDSGGLGLQEMIVQWAADQKGLPIANQTNEIKNASTPL